MRFDRFTIRGQEAVQEAIGAAEKNQNQQVEPEHLLAAMLEQKEGVVRPILGKIGANAQTIITDVAGCDRKISEGFGRPAVFQLRGRTRSFRMLRKRPKRCRTSTSRPNICLLAIAAEKEGDAGRILRSNGITRDDLEKVITDMRGGSRITDPNAEENFQALEKYAQDLTERARKGKLDPVIGRDDEIRRTIQILSREQKIILF